MTEALLARRKLGNELQRIREDARLTQAEVGKILWSSGTTVHRMEQGRSQIKGPQIESLLRALKIDDEKLEQRLLQLAGISQDTEHPYERYRESLSPEVLQFFGYEEVATHIRDLQIVMVPGLLQTADYAREVIRSVQGIEGDIDGFLSSRKDRQEKIIYRGSPPSLSFIIDEAVLYRPFGAAPVMTEQLLRLQELDRHPKISIRIVPLSAGASPALRGSFTLLEFAEYPDVLFIEGPRGDVNIDEPEASSARRATWTTIEKQYVSQEHLDHYIQRALDRLS
jgi:transcriptional regulator with XRE-family HTH domain